ncbi:MAG: glycosyl hydrolase [Phycisphaera sp.]|nr:glycosyl hydrolase [Phycisphaera sp.]
MKINTALAFANLLKPAQRIASLAAQKARAIDRSWNPTHGTPVFTVKGRYTSRGWTEWTQGFQYGCAILAGEMTGDNKLIDLGRRRTVERMLPHVTHTGVHDHGFNNLSTYGNLLRLLSEGTLRDNEWERRTYENALACSGAVQATRWSGAPPVDSKHTAHSPALGYVYSFNGPHSLFVDTMRTVRILGVAWQFGHVLMHENDKKANLLKRSVLHGLTTSQYVLFHGDTPHTYDIPGRTAHEAVFNRNDGAFRCRSSQQGYSPFSTWTRGLAWAMLGYSEELEFFKTISTTDFKSATGLDKANVVKVYERCAIETCDHYIDGVTALDGIPYWDDGAPNLHKVSDWPNKPADPFNNYEPVDSSAAAIAAQGLIRLGQYLGKSRGKRYTQAGLTVANTLFDVPYLSTSPRHQGLLLHSVYHRPNNWDYIPPGHKVPCGESSLWGDYHAIELAHLLERLASPGHKSPYPTFFI